MIRKRRRSSGDHAESCSYAGSRPSRDLPDAYSAFNVVDSDVCLPKRDIIWAMRGVWFMSFGVVLMGCSFIDDFGRFRFADESEVLDGSVSDGSQSSRTCTDPCQTDAILDFSASTQGEGVWQWRYLKDTRDALGIDYRELTLGEYEGWTAWTEASPPPAIVGCAHAEREICAGVRDRLLLITEPPGVTDGGDPILSATAQATTTYRISGTYRTPAGETRAEPLEFFVSRNTRSDMIERLSFIPSIHEGHFSIPVDVVNGDQLLVGVRPARGTTMIAPIALDVQISRDLEKLPLADCLYHLTFDEDQPFVDRCQGTLIDASGPNFSVDSPSPNLREARRIPPGSALYSQPVWLDYREDFTVQMWLQIDSAHDNDTVIYRDHGGMIPQRAGGVALFMNMDRVSSTAPQTITALFMYVDPYNGAIPNSDPNINCFSTEGVVVCVGKLSVELPPLGSWHHYRIVRSTASNRVSFCIDGIEIATATVSGEAHLTANTSPIIGHSLFGPPDRRFSGSIDDLRILRRALPCTPR